MAHSRELPDGAIEHAEMKFASVEDKFKRGQVTVWSIGGGVKFLFDTDRGEVPFYLDDEGWKKLQDIVWQALMCKGPFDRSEGDITNESDE